MSVDPVVSLVARFSVALVLAWAAAHKARDLAAFGESLRGYRLIPKAAVGSFAVVLIMVEAVAAVALLYGPSATFAAFAAVGLFSAYSVAIAINLLRDRRDLDCGCGSGARPQPLSEWLLVRNAALIAFALVAGASVSARTLGWIDALGALAALTTLVLLWLASSELLATVTSRQATGGQRRGGSQTQLAAFGEGR